MRVIILAAGQGKRLLPLTAEVPKALLDIHGRTLIGRQIDAFAACGLKDFVVVTGYGARRMEEALADIAQARGITIKTVFNPFYAVADNLASCWMAVTVAVNHKDSYDADDMKVMLDAGRLTEIGKTLPVDTVDAEAIGFYIFRGEGGKTYVSTLEAAMRDPSGLKQWFPSAVGTLAKTVDITTIAVNGIRWCEVDFPVDLQQARQLAVSWS